jgi:hypothetical protein
MSRDIHAQLGLAAEFETLAWADAAFRELPVTAHLINETLRFHFFC